MIDAQTGAEPRTALQGEPRLTVVSGPSGVGKSSVLSEVRRRAPEVYFSVSATTRAPRLGEIDGEHYHFVGTAEFERMIAAGEPAITWLGAAGEPVRIGAGYEHFRG